MLKYFRLLVALLPIIMAAVAFNSGQLAWLSMRTEAISFVMALAFLLTVAIHYQWNVTATTSGVKDIIVMMGLSFGLYHAGYLRIAGQYGPDMMLVHALSVAGAFYLTYGLFFGMAEKYLVEQSPPS